VTVASELEQLPKVVMLDVSMMLLNSGHRCVVHMELVIICTYGLCTSMYTPIPDLQDIVESIVYTAVPKFRKYL
jgi:hypothetical protein